jgi:hypothetical protein
MSWGQATQRPKGEVGNEGMNFFPYEDPMFAPFLKIILCSPLGLKEGVNIPIGVQPLGPKFTPKGQTSTLGANSCC